MRVLNQLAVPQDSSPEFPFSTIQNETPTQEGTPVYRELYGDILTNIYKILLLTGVAPTGTEDSETSQYQLVSALRKFYNELNDVEQTMSLAGTTWTVNLDLSILPDKFVFVGRATEDYVDSTSYTFKGTGATTIPAVSPTGFSASDAVIVIIDLLGVRIYSLNEVGSNIAPTEVFTVLSAPISFNDSNVMYYLSDGKIFTNSPSSDDIQNTIQVGESNVNLFVIDAIVIQGRLVCLVFDSAAISYTLYSFSTSDFSSYTITTISGFVVPTGTDNGVYMFSDGTHIYFTNEFNGSATDENISKFLYTPGTDTLTFVSTVPLVNGSFTKTTNAAIGSGNLYTFIDNKLRCYNLSTAVFTEIISNYNLILGVLFKFSSKIYYTTNEVATEFNL